MTSYFNKTNCVFSNKIEILYAVLKNTILDSNSGPFDQRLIVVPSPAVKTWLSFQLAKDFGIWMGIEIGFLEQTLTKLQREMASPTSELTPSREVLALAIEKEILRNMGNPIWEPVKKYVESSSSKHQRVQVLAEQLTDLFIKYGVYGGAMIQEWEEEESPLWQAELWRNLFCSLDYRWTYPIRQYNLQKSLKSPSQSSSLYLFGMSYLSPIHHQFLCHIGEHLSVNYFLLSPCQLFWSDQVSDRDSLKLKRFYQKKEISEAQIDELDLYLRERHPLLANYGKLGREIAKEVEESEIIVSSAYGVPSWVKEEPSYEELLDDELCYFDENVSLLGAIQADMVVMRNTEETEPIPLEDEDSIQLHSATSKRREVEIVFDLLHHFMKKDQILPENIIVMAPNIIDYEPYIRSTFENKLDYQIMDLSSRAASSVVSGFFHLIQLAQGRWNLTSILHLFHNESFRSKQKITLEELELLSEWMVETKVRWGFDQQHRQEILQGHYPERFNMSVSSHGTWQEATDELLLSLISKHDEERVINHSSSQTLKKWIDLFTSLRDDLTPLQDKSAFTLPEWSSYLTLLIESYFEVDSDSKELIEGAFKSFGQSPSKLQKEKFQFRSIQDKIEKLFSQPNSIYRESHLHAIRFCSMLPMRAIPAEVIILMGMDESSFPKIQRPNSLDIIYKYPGCDYIPTMNDYDRFLFLEALLSARKYFHIIYERVSQEDGEKQSPSILVEELQAYVERGFTQKIKEIMHPSRPYDSTLFSKKNSLKSYSEQSFQLAKAFNSSQKKEERFFSSFSIKKEEIEKPEEITIKDLTLFAKNPLRTYFNNELGIYLSLDDERYQDEESFELTPLDLYQIRQKLLKGENLGEYFVHEPFQSLSQEKVEGEIAVLEKAFETFDLSIDDIEELELSENNSLKVPTKYGEVLLSGKLESVTKKGLLTYCRDDKIDIVKVWPLFLVYHCYFKESEVYQKNLLFLRNAKKKETFLKDPIVELSRYIEYYLISKKNPSMILPEWTYEFVNNDDITLMKTMVKKANDPFRPIYNDYLKWSFRDEGKSDLKEWKTYSEDIFKKVYDGWYSK